MFLSLSKLRIRIFIPIFLDTVLQRQNYRLCALANNLRIQHDLCKATLVLHGSSLLYVLHCIACGLWRCFLHTGSSPWIDNWYLLTFAHLTIIAPVICNLDFTIKSNK